MIGTVPNILARIIAHKRQELKRLSVSRSVLEQQAARMAESRRDFRAEIAARRPAIIGEIKKASPSKGILTADFDPVSLAKEYERGGAAALSVLTDAAFFQGSLADLQAARAAVSLPVLRKDFTLEATHVLEAAACGADAVLLIVAILDEKQIRELRGLVAQFGMAAVVEVHDARELETALAAGADIIGVNNRNLATFEVTLETSLRLAERIPNTVLKISESGIHSPADILRLENAGYHAFLVGEHLIESSSPSEAVRLLLGRHTQNDLQLPIVKICGITNREDALAAIDAGASALGFNFCATSPRYIAPEAAADLLQSLPRRVWKVGVFVDDPRVSQLAAQLGLDVVQLHGSEIPCNYPAHVRVWKAVRVDGRFSLAEWEQVPAEAVLLDGSPGGGGKTFDWSLAASSAKKIIIAGGLDASNIRQAIEQARPWGVDACSRLESRPGKKDQIKMAEFIKAARWRR